MAMKIKNIKKITDQQADQVLSIVQNLNLLSDFRTVNGSANNIKEQLDISFGFAAIGNKLDVIIAQPLLQKLKEHTERVADDYDNEDKPASEFPDYWKTSASNFIESLKPEPVT